MNQLLVIVPTRGRPYAAVELKAAFDDTCLADTRLLFAVDNDDPWLAEYVNLGLNIVIGPRIRMCPTLSLVAVAHADEYEYLGFMGDDHRPRTLGWDLELINAVSQTPGTIAYGNDLFQGPNLPTAVVLDSRVVRTLGYMVPPGLLHMYADNAWKTWGERTGKLRYLDHVIIEHDHPQAGKGKMDEQYNEVWALMDPDRRVWESYAATQLDSDIEKLKSIS